MSLLQKALLPWHLISADSSGVVWSPCSATPLSRSGLWLRHSVRGGTDFSAIWFFYVNNLFDATKIPISPHDHKGLLRSTHKGWKTSPRENSARRISFRKNLSLIPLLGLICCLYMMAELSVWNWTYFTIWLIIGLLIYFTYSRKNSKLNFVEKL